MPTWVPFLPSLTVPYTLQVVASYVLAMFIGNRSLRHAVWKAYFLSMAAVFAVWREFPTIMQRPPAPSAWWDWPYAILLDVDVPVHVFPAGHILMPVLIIWAFAYDRPRWLLWLVPAQLLGAVAIAGTWQHRPVDILLGASFAVMAGFVFGVGKRLAPASSAE